MFGNNWYILKKNQAEYRIEYDIRNRILAAFSFILLSIMYLEYIFDMGYTISKIAHIIYFIIQFYLFIMISLTDFYLFDFTKNSFISKKGLFFFLKKLTFPFSDIERLEIRPFEVGHKKKISFEFFVFLKDGSCLKLGNYNSSEKLQEILSLWAKNQKNSQIS